MKTPVKTVFLCLALLCLLPARSFAATAAERTALEQSRAQAAALT